MVDNVDRLCNCTCCEVVVGSMTYTAPGAIGFGTELPRATSTIACFGWRAETSRLMGLLSKVEVPLPFTVIVTVIASPLVGIVKKSEISYAVAPVFSVVVEPTVMLYVKVLVNPANCSVRYSMCTAEGVASIVYNAGGFIVAPAVEEDCGADTGSRFEKTYAPEAV